ncbi:hypothetical protein D6X60_05025 [Escherichia albertii]|nr:hypothetical protein [Escherichia albertii]EEW7339874.1 hypothetical protein [Escherichia albertii]
MQQYIYLYLAIKHQFSDISFYRKDDSVMTVASNLERNLCAPAHSQGASPLASGTGARTPYPPKNIKPAIASFPDNRQYPSLPVTQRNNRRRWV